MRGLITSPATFNLSLNTCPLASWLSGGEARDNEGQRGRGDRGWQRSRDGALFECQDFRGQTLSERQLCPAALGESPRKAPFGRPPSQPIGERIDIREGYLFHPTFLLSHF